MLRSLLEVFVYDIADYADWLKIQWIRQFWKGVTCFKNKIFEYILEMISYKYASKLDDYALEREQKTENGGSVDIHHLVIVRQVHISFVVDCMGMH